MRGECEPIEKQFIVCGKSFAHLIKQSAVAHTVKRLATRLAEKLLAKQRLLKTRFRIPAEAVIHLAARPMHGHGFIALLPILHGQAIGKLLRRRKLQRKAFHRCIA